MDEQKMTDLFLESANIDVNTHGYGDVCDERTVDGMKVYRMTVKNKADEMRVGCRRGTHITVFTPQISSMDFSQMKKLSGVVADEITYVVSKALKSKEIKGKSFLVVGLGNRNITADSVGPLCAEKIRVTRHISLLSGDMRKKRYACDVSAVQCGVMGETGIRSAELICGLVKEISPDAVIAVDALASRSLSRLAATVQLSDSGISPGAGIGNRQITVNRDTVGVPVIAIGVPTVVSTASLIYDLLSRSELVDKFDREALFASMTREKGYFVSPKECDIIAENAAFILAEAVNEALL